MVKGHLTSCDEHECSVFSFFFSCQSKKNLNKYFFKFQVVIFCFVFVVFVSVHYNWLVENHTKSEGFKVPEL